MALSTELISQFAKIVAPKEQRPESTTVTGTAKEYAGKIYVQIDGSDQLTPIASSTVGMKDGDKVTVQIKNHSATITGNASDPSAGKSYADDINNKVDDVSDQISEFEIIIADKVDVGDLNAVNGRIDNLVSENVTITGKLDAVEAEIGELTADNVTINGKLDAAEADIENLTTTKLDASIADIKYATIENLEATNADIHNLEADYGEFKDLTTEKFTAVDAEIEDLDTKKLSAEQADLKYANIDFANIGKAAIENFFSKSGMIGDLVVGEGTITGTLVGVTIKGDLIEGGTVKADKLVVQGEDGLYYKLNVTGETVAAEQTEYNSLNGSIITAKSITAEKISVNDLVAFGATIGGFHITEDSLYSGVKETVDNTTRGTYMNDDGEFAIGDGAHYLKFFKDADGIYKLAISADAIKFGTDGSDLQQTAEGLTTKVEEAVNTAESAKTTATEAKQTADGLSTTVSEVKQTADGAMEKATTVAQTVDGLEVKIDGIADDIGDAAKTATNYLKFDSSGLCVGNMTGSLGYNALITSSQYQIRNGSTVLSSFGASQINLGQNSTSSVVSLCGGRGSIRYGSNSTSWGATRNYLDIRGSSGGNVLMSVTGSNDDASGMQTAFVELDGPSQYAAIAGKNGTYIGTSKVNNGDIRVLGRSFTYNGSNVLTDNVAYVKSGEWDVLKFGKFRIVTRLYMVGNATVNQTWGSWLYSALIGMPNYPVTFAARPYSSIEYVYADPGYQQDCMVMRQSSRNSTTNPGAVYLVRPSGAAATVGHPVFAIFAAGYVA